MPWPVLVDDLDWSVARSYTTLPNAQFLIDSMGNRMKPLLGGIAGRGERLPVTVKLAGGLAGGALALRMLRR